MSSPELPKRPVGPPRPKRRLIPRLRTVHEVSAGGLVVAEVTQEPDCLLISRFDRRNRHIWSFPKGHVEGEETWQETAVREVHEETGIEAEVLSPLGKVDFWFMADGRRIHKTVHHFLMVARGGVISDEDPEVESVEWVAWHEVRGRLAYSDERSLFKKATRLLTDLGPTQS